MAKKVTSKAKSEEIKEEKAAAAVEVKAAEKEEVKAVKEEATAKKAPAKKTTAKVGEPVIKCTIEFQGKNTAVRSIVDNIFEIEGGKEAVKTLDIYVQPENNIAYYVVNGKEEGKSVEF